MCTNLYYGNSFRRKYPNPLFKALGVLADNHLINN